MSTMDAIRSGLREMAGRKKLVAAWYLANVGVALAVVAPLVVLMATALGSSLENERIFENFDFSWAVETALAGHYQQLIAWMPVMAGGLALYVLVTVWLTGGLMAVINDPKESYFAGCARWFPPFLRLAVLMLPVYAIPWLGRAAVGTIVRKVFDDSMAQAPLSFGSMAGWVVFFALLTVANGISDFAKLEMVLGGHRKAFAALRGAIRFVFGRIGRVFALLVALFAIALAMLAAYGGLSELFGQGSGVGVLLVLVLRQAYAVGRSWFRMVSIAALFAFRREALPKPAPTPVVEPPQANNEEWAELI